MIERLETMLNRKLTDTERRYCFEGTAFDW
jgi:hypothetical protein